jgi:hypothetical protein
MNIDINGDYFNDDIDHHLKQRASQGIYQVDPSEQANNTFSINTGTSSNNIVVGNNDTFTLNTGLWNQLQRQNTGIYNSPPSFSSVTIDPITHLTERLNKLELDNKLLRLKILSLEGKFTQEEVANIRKMLMAEDESSKTLADSIIENA